MLLLYGEMADQMSMRVEYSGLDVTDGLIYSPNAPLEQAYLPYKWAANAGEGWAIKFQHAAQIATNANEATKAKEGGKASGFKKFKVSAAKF